MTLALTLTITKATIGMLAVMVVLALVGGVVTYVITGALTFMGIDEGGKFHDTMAFLHIPLTIVGAFVGGYLGYLWMS